MLRGFSLKGKGARSIALSLSVVFMLAPVAQAASEMSDGELIKAYMLSFAQEDWDAAVVTAQLYLTATEGSTATRVIDIQQRTRMMMGRVYSSKLENHVLAADVLQDYVDTEPAPLKRKAMLLLSTSYQKATMFEECIAASTNALAYPDDPEMEEEPDYSDLPKLERRRKEAELELAKEEAELDAKEKDFKGWTQEMRNLLYYNWAESLYGLGKWAECIDPYTYIIDHSSDSSQRKGYSIMQVINALIKMKDYDRLLRYIPELYRTDARYDIRVNLALMNAADALFKEKEYHSALPLYRMILPREELLAYHQPHLEALRIECGLDPQNPTLPEADEDGYIPDDPRSQELRELEGLLNALKKMPPYEAAVQYQMANLYKEVKRYWEAASFFNIVFEADPASEMGQSARGKQVETLLGDLAELSEAEKVAYKYLDENKEGVVPRQVAYALTAFYHKNEKLDQVSRLRKYVDGFVKTDDPELNKYDCELYFLQGIAELIIYNYEASEATLQFLIDTYPGSHQEGNATYWLGLTKLFLKKYQEALDLFDKYIANYPDGKRIPDAYYQGGAALLGLQEIDKSFDRFTLVIEQYPDAKVYPDARNMRGDVYGNRGELDEALVDYEAAWSVASAEERWSKRQADYATFQSAAIYEADDKYDDIIRVVERYMDVFDEEADIAKGMYWIGKTKIQQDLYEEALDAYLTTVVKYGDDLKQDGVDMILKELIKVSGIYLSNEQRDQLLEDLKTERDAAADKLTLQLRIKSTIATIEGTQVELGSELLDELTDLASATPPVLGIMCEAALALEKYDRADDMIDVFTVHYPESEFLKAAYKLKAFGQFAQKDYDNALKTIQMVYDIFGPVYDLAWTQIMKGEIMLAREKYDAAAEIFRALVETPAWRGEPYAQGYFMLGKVEEARGKLGNAHAYYQRVYMQYKGWAEGDWAAKAYLAAADCLKKLNMPFDARNTYRAFLFDRFLNQHPLADTAREELGATEVQEIETFIATGGRTNVTVEVKNPDAPKTNETTTVVSAEESE